MSKLLYTVGCYSLQQKILEIIFNYASYDYGYIQSVQDRLSSLFPGLVDVVDLIKSCCTNYHRASFDEISRRLLNILNEKFNTKVVSKKIKSFELDRAQNRLITLDVRWISWVAIINYITDDFNSKHKHFQTHAPSYLNLNLGTRSIDFPISSGGNQITVTLGDLQIAWIDKWVEIETKYYFCYNFLLRFYYYPEMM